MQWVVCRLRFGIASHFRPCSWAQRSCTATKVEGREAQWLRHSARWYKSAMSHSQVSVAYAMVMIGCLIRATMARDPFTNATSIVRHAEFTSCSEMKW